MLTTLVLVWTIVAVALNQTSDAGPTSKSVTPVLQVFAAVVLIALVWGVVWFGSGLISGVREQHRDPASRRPDVDP